MSTEPCCHRLNILSFSITAGAQNDYPEGLVSRESFFFSDCYSNIIYTRYNSSLLLNLPHIQSPRFWICLGSKNQPWHSQLQHVWAKGNLPSPQLPGRGNSLPFPAPAGWQDRQTAQGSSGTSPGVFSRLGGVELAGKKGKGLMDFSRRGRKWPWWLGCSGRVFLWWDKCSKNGEKLSEEVPH